MMLSRSASPRGRKDWKRRKSGAEINTREIGMKSFRREKHTIKSTKQRRLSLTAKTWKVSELPRMSITAITWRVSEWPRLSITAKTRRVSELPRLSTMRGAEVCPVRGKGSTSISNMRMV